MSLKDFELLVSIGVFNADRMNSAIFAFKRYEDASLSYAGLNKHEHEQVGGWDTTLSQSEVRELDNHFNTRSNVLRRKANGKNKEGKANENGV